jgi:CRP-like cAMP-binding protein
MSAAISLDTPKNRLLAALPAEVYQRLLPHLEVVDLPVEQVIHGYNEPAEYIYFPQQGIVSLVSIMANGATVEVGLVGKEGMVGMQALLGGNTMPNQAFAQIPGQATRIRTEHLQVEFDRGGALQKLLLRYVQALYTQVSQTAACNRLHTIEARLARWLLLVRYSLEADEILLTQEYISQMLGTRRAGVTEAASDLQKAGLIRYRRGRITILDPADLEAVACECYQVVRDEFDRLLR